MIKNVIPGVSTKLQTCLLSKIILALIIFSTQLLQAQDQDFYQTLQQELQTEYGLLKGNALRRYL
jgi:hypothetical protein